MRRALATIFMWLVLPASAWTAGIQQAPLPDSDELYGRIREKYRPMYEKYVGIENKSRVEARRYDSKTNELKESSRLVTVVRSYFYKKADRRVLEYEKDGVELDPSEADNSRQGEPMFPIWDRDGPSNYRVIVVGRREVRGQGCYVLKVEAKKKTKRHFEGSAYVNAETLAVVSVEGGMADVPFGVDRVRFRADFKQQGDLMAFEGFEMEAFADIPLLYPDVRFVSTSQVLESRGIPK